MRAALPVEKFEGLEHLLTLVAGGLERCKDSRKPELVEAVAVVSRWAMGERGRREPPAGRRCGRCGAGVGGPG